MELIGLSGYATVGKSSIAKTLARWHFPLEIVSFASPLKARVDALFPPETPKALKRDTYVAYGKAMRAIDKDYWIKELEKGLSPAGRYIIDDVRYANEVEWIRSKGGQVVRIFRPGVVAANAEETESFAAMPGCDTILNNDTIEVAAHDVWKLIQAHNKFIEETARGQSTSNAA